MDMETAHEDNLLRLLEALKSLITPTENLSNVTNLSGVFTGCIQNAIRILGFEDVKNLPRLAEGSDAGSSETWNFVEVAMYILCGLKQPLGEEDLSVSQRKNIRSCLQFIVSLGLCPNLIPGVGVPLSCRSSFLKNLKFDDVNVLCKYERICFVIKSLLYCCENKTLRSLIIANAFEDILAGLIQLSFAPLKKPTDKEENLLRENATFVMSINLWKKLQLDQTFFRQQLLKFVNEVHQPTVMVKLMILQADQGQCKPPLWMKKKCSSLLTKCLIQPDGVASLIRATIDSAPDMGADWEKVETLAKVITSPSNHLRNIANQLVKLLDVLGKGPSNISVVVVACVKQLLNQDTPLCQELIIDPLLHPFLSCCTNDVSGKSDGVILSEEALLSSFDGIYNCFSSNASQVSSNYLPVSLLTPCVSFLFRLYCKVIGSASHILSHVEEILYQILCDCDSLVLVEVLRCILLVENSEGIPAFPHNLCFSFGSGGGVQVEKISEGENNTFIQFSVEEAGDNIVVLLEHQDSNHLVSVKVFVALIKLLIDIGLNTCGEESHEPRLDTMEDTLSTLIYSSQKQLGIVRVLAVLVENENVQLELARDPTPILTFLLSLLESASQLVTDSSETDESGLHCVFVSLMILNVMLEKCHENSNWTVFKQLLSPLAAIRDKARDSELSRLASGIYNSIATHGALQSSNVQTRDLNMKKTRCENALQDSCDPLIPVRGHALVEITKLLWQRDSETISKKAAVFCVLQENLKSDDSFIYLAAINGMVAMAAVEPKQAVKSLVEEYAECTTAGDSCGRNPELRMKVGEVLVKLTNALGEMATIYKNDIINAFLIGVKDEDHLMRASSLSNLGEACRILGFRVGSILQEILLCVQSVVNFDKAVEPRRAAVMVITLLIQGLHKETLIILKDALLELYRSLKHVYINDKDDVVRLHAQLALQELGTVTHEFLFPKPKLEKKIHML